MMQASLVTGIVMVLGAAVSLCVFQRRCGRQALAPAAIVLLIGLPGYGVSYITGIFADIFLFGFDIDGKAPPWERFIIPAVTVLGTLLFTLGGTFAALSMVGFRFRAEPGEEHAADYDERIEPRPLENGPMDAGR